METLGKVLILLGVSGAFTYLLTYLRIPTMIATGLFSITSNKIVILILLNILMLFLGCLIEMACLILMLTPVILPIWMQLGLSPIHLGIVMVLNLGIGLLTPPVGSTCSSALPFPASRSRPCPRRWCRSTSPCSLR